MCSVAKPIIKQIRDNREALDFFETVSLPAEDEKTQAIIMNFPTVYIHNWQDSGAFEVYVGETNNIFKRTRQHYDAALNQPGWRSKLSKKDASLFIIGHEHFNKSLTLDIENRLMHYMMSVERVKRVYNLRDNPQTSYYPMEEFDEIFGKIWRGLRKENKNLFPTESAIKDSAIYKASPLHKLTKEQEKARELIIQKVSEALEKEETKQLIFIDGEAGTGKTVLTSSTFYELYCQAEESNKALKCQLLVNHDEQIIVYEQIAEKLGLTEKYGKVVSKPTTFINNHSENAPIDVAFVDEAHLLLTQGKHICYYDIVESVRRKQSLGSQKLPGLFARVAMKMPCLHEHLRSTATTRKLVFELWKEVSTCLIGVTYHVNILAVRHSFRTVRCIVRNISLYIQRTELMRQSVVMVLSGSVREGSS